MKKTMLKVTAAALLIGQLLTAGGGFEGNATAAAAVNTTKPVPAMTDNLFKYGLKKDVELPVTVTAGGLSYTLEKIMIYDTKSKDAQALIKKYDYVLLDSNDYKYFIWTKITVENKSTKIIQQNAKDLSPKWRLIFGDPSNGEAFAVMPNASVKNPNSKQALWNWSLKPGEKLSTYQAYSYGGQFNLFLLSVDNKDGHSFKYVAEKKV